jgi:hypothetical protein
MAQDAIMFLERKIRLCGKDVTDALQAYCGLSMLINMIYGSESKSQEAVVHAPYLTKNRGLVSVSCSSVIDLIVNLQEIIRLETSSSWLLAHFHVFHEDSFQRKVVRSKTASYRRARRDG